MKKFLLPLVALLLGGAVAQAEEITVKYNGYQPTQSNAIKGYDILQPTTHELVDNGDKTYTIKNFMNAKTAGGESFDLTFDLQFSIDNRYNLISLVGVQGSNQLYLTDLPKEYFVDLTSADGKEKLDYQLFLYYPSSTTWRRMMSMNNIYEIEESENSPYKYRAIIATGFKVDELSCPDCLYDSWTTLKNGAETGAGVYATFDFLKKSDTETGIEDVIVNENAPAVYYNLHGVSVAADNLTPGVYVKVQGGKISKVLVK